MSLPTLQDFSIARERIAPVVVHTPLIPIHSRPNILLKPEIHQKATSFKIRGVFNAVACLTEEARAAGISTVSAGNTAQALAWTGKHFNIEARSIMPKTAPETKVEAMRNYGGIPILVDRSEVFRYLQEHLWEQEPYAFIHPWTNRNVMMGHGSIGLEIVEDFPEVERVYIPVGGGGLIGGVGLALKALKPEIKIIAVEPQQCCAFYTSLQQGKAGPAECNTICDGVAVPYITEEMFAILREIVDDYALVPEQAVKATIRRLAMEDKMVVEGAGALATAAAMEREGDSKGAVCLVTGGSIDMKVFIDILQRNSDDLC